MTCRMVRLLPCTEAVTPACDRTKRGCLRGKHFTDEAVVTKDAPDPQRWQAVACKPDLKDSPLTFSGLFEDCLRYGCVVCGDFVSEEPRCPVRTILGEGRRLRAKKK